jgi:type II secretory ATPase GspE/PulE/Tfp pilus assembly ATPase PilB-like protein
MPIVFVAAAEPGAYISIVKFAPMVALFLVWLPLINWVYRDAHAVQTNVINWTLTIVLVGVAGLTLWLLLPMYLIGLLLYLIALAAASMAYVIHRNGRVSDFEKVLTSAHLKSLFVNEDKKLTKASRGMTLVTANNNEVPLPRPKSRESFGFQTLCELLDDALWRRATIIHLMPGQQEYGVTYFIDGMASPQPSRSREEVDYLIHFLKEVADLDINERRKPQTGKFRILKDGAKLQWELTTAGSTAGEQVKLLKKEEYSLIKLEDMGMTPEQVEVFRGFRSLERGLILLSGPPKSGVTSTMYTMLRNNHDPFMNNINMLEKNPAGDIQNITQYEYSTAEVGVTYSRKLQTVLRTGPNILGVEACDDKECAVLVTQASKDGLIVYAMLEAGSVMQALTKWIQLVGDKNLAASTLTAIVNQRVVRVLCEQCKQAYQPNQDLFRKFNIPADKIKVLYRPGEIEYDKHNRPIICEACQGTGYLGRTGVFETIVLDDKMRETIRTAAAVKDIAAAFRKAGMLYLQEQAIKKVAKGTTSIQEVIRQLAVPQTPAAAAAAKPAKEEPAPGTAG